MPGLDPLETRTTVGLPGLPRGCSLLGRGTDVWTVWEEFPGSGCPTRVFFLVSLCGKGVRSSVPVVRRMPCPKFVPHFAGEGSVSHEYRV